VQYCRLRFGLRWLHRAAILKRAFRSRLLRVLSRPEKQCGKKSAERMDMQTFGYSNSPWAVRDDLVEAYQYTWRKIAQPGTWLTGSERVQIAHEVRQAKDCALCRTRKAALSPFADKGAHYGDHGALSAAQVDVAHRLTTDASRLTGRYLGDVAADGVSVEMYVEILSVVVALIAIDAFHTALGFELEPLPAPDAGEPTCYRPAAAVRTDAWVPMVPLEQVAETEADMYSGMGRSANVITAMSVVPDAVRLLRTQSAAMYLEVTDVANPATNGGRALGRPQIELIAGRVSALNDCFY